MDFITVLLLCFLPVLCTWLSISYTKRRVKELSDIMVSFTDPDSFTINVVDDSLKHVWVAPSVCKAIENARKSMKG